MKPLENLLFLKKDMESKGWIIDRFRFEYKSKNYIVLVILYTQEENRPKYALLKLRFLLANNFDYQIEFPANTQRLITEAKILRDFFGIDYGENLGEILKEFSFILGTYIPKEMLPLTNPEERNAIISTLSKIDSDDPNKIYCYKVKRNPCTYNHIKNKYVQQKRSPYNDNKTKLLRNSLYNLLGKDETISFCYSPDPSKDYSDEEIINNWKNNN